MSHSNHHKPELESTPPDSMKLPHGGFGLGQNTKHVNRINSGSVNNNSLH